VGAFDVPVTSIGTTKAGHRETERRAGGIEGERDEPDNKPGFAFGDAAYDPETVARLRKAGFLVVLGWADSLLAEAADLALPVATHAEKDGTFVNSQQRLQRFRRAFFPTGQSRSGVEVLADLLSRIETGWAGLSTGAVFNRLAAQGDVGAGLSYEAIPAEGVELSVPGAPPDDLPHDLKTEQISG